MNEIEQLKQRIENLENIINFFVKGDRYSFIRQVDFGKNIKMSPHTFISCPGVDAGEGTRFGTSADDQIGFFGVDPVRQQASPGFPSISTVSGSGADGTINANFSSIGSSFDDVKALLTNLGLTD